MNKYDYGYIIRNFEIEDAERIGKIDSVLELSYRYNGDFKAENIFCAVNEQGDILGVGHLQPHDTWFLIENKNMSSDFIYKLWLDITINPEFTVPESVKDDLMHILVIRAKELKRNYPEKRINVIKFIDSRDNEEIDYFLSKGFVVYCNNLVLKRDLTGEIPDVPQIEGINVINWRMSSEEEKRKYLAAEASANSGVCWSFNLLQWYSFGPEWNTFTAFHGQEPVGSTMTWMITDERSSTENVFVVPDWRKKGVAKLVITETLKFLKNNGKKIATLCVYGDNKPAIALYKSLGYKIYYINVELGYDL